MHRTISFTIPKNKELYETLLIYNQVVNLHIQQILNYHTFSKNKLHILLYQKIRKKYPQFPSALIQCARDQAVEMRKGNKFSINTKKRPDSAMRFDHRTMKVFLDSGIIQLTTVKGRKKYTVKVASHFHKYLSWKVKSLNLGIKNKKMVLKVIVQGKSPEQNKCSEILGIDVGLRNFAALSDGQMITSKEVNRIRRKHAHLRRELQSKGTRSAKRRLQTLSGRERRFIQSWTHRLAGYIASLPYGAFAMEDLKGIRNGRRGKGFNRRRHHWNYGQFRNFLKYKAQEKGKTVILIEPKYTSQQCISCLSINSKNRKGKSFHCLECNFKADADINASKNISRRGAKLFFKQAVANQPYIQSHQIKT